VSVLGPSVIFQQSVHAQMRGRNPSELLALLVLLLANVVSGTAFATSGATLVHTGGAESTPAAVQSVPSVAEGNLARSESAKAFGSSAILGTTFGEVNDGRYGDRWCWTGDLSPVSGETYVGVYFTGGEVEIQQVALGRDSAAGAKRSRDRTPREYRVETTLDVFDFSDDAAVARARWTEIARLDDHSEHLVPQHRRLYRLDRPVTLRAVRVVVGAGHAIDELELGGALPPFPPPTVSQIYTQVIERSVAVEDACAWPNLTLFPDETIVATIHSSPSHGQMPGDVQCWASLDGGRTWSLRGVPGKADARTVRMNTAAGLVRNGDFVVLCGGWGYAPTFRNETLPVWVCRSTDEGRTWTRDRHRVTQPVNGPWGIPFGDIIPMPQNRLAICFYGVNAQTGLDDISYVLFSEDDGRMWGGNGQYRLLDHGVNETALLRLGEGKLLAAARANYQGDYLKYYVSSDEGLNWSAKGRLTGNDRHPGHLLRLEDGRIMLSFGMRDRPGIGVRISGDDGATWRPMTTLLSLPNASRDCGYPATVELRDGTLVTAYYADGRPSRNGYFMGVARWRLHTPRAEPVDAVPTFLDGNLARAPNAVAFGTPDDYDQTIDEINDGQYGDPSSYIAGQAGLHTGLRYVGVQWVNGARSFDHVTIGRDNTGAVKDRASIAYVLEYTADTFHLPEDEAAADEVVRRLRWHRIGRDLGGHLKHGTKNPALRRRYKLASPVTATAIRLRLAKGDGVDELEVYLGAPPR